MQLLCGQNLSKLVDYSFGDQRASWDTNLIGGFMKLANANNQEFLTKAKEFEGQVMTLYIDNIRLYPRPIPTDKPADNYINNVLMRTNNLLALCSLLPNNRFVIFTGEEDTPIDEYIRLPDNVLKIYAVNALYNTDRIIPFPIGLQRQIGENDNRLAIMKTAIDLNEIVKDNVNLVDEPSKLLYINCGIERNPERLPLAKFETNSWCTTRFDKDSKFFPYERYNEFLSELRDHKFVACPKGHGYDTHRIWETLYMRRVPVMLDDPYFRRLLEGFSIYWIKSWDELTEEFLRNEPTFKEVDMNKLDLNQIFDRCRQTGAIKALTT